MRGLGRCALFGLVFAAGLVSCRHTDFEAFVGRPEDVQEVQFSVSRIGEARVDVVKRITDADAIKHVMESRIGGREPYTRHVFVRVISFVRSDGSRVTVRCEYGRKSRAIRIGDTQYGLPKATADLIQSYYIESESASSEGAALE